MAISLGQRFIDAFNHSWVEPPVLSCRMERTAVLSAHAFRSIFGVAMNSWLLLATPARPFRRSGARNDRRLQTELSR